MIYLVKKGGWLLGCLMLAACSISGDPATPPERIQEHINWLAADERNGRLAGSADEAAAANYIADRFEQAGLKPAGDQETYFQHFVLSGPMAQAMELEEKISRNVVGLVEGTASPSQYILVGAHYDGQGYGGIISMDHEQRGTLHNSADDNASGVAGVLHLADRFADRPAEKTVIFAVFSGEELGLQGSRYFAGNLPAGADSILAMINFDMIGRLTDHKLTLFGTGTSPVWNDLLEGMENDSLVIDRNSAGTGASDHASFHEIQVPALHYFTGVHDDYHRETDTPEKINAVGVYRVAGHAERLIRSLAERDAADIEFTEGSGQSRSPMDREGVTLGVFPDYSYTGEGFRIENVRGGGPADRAGIQPGDIMLEIGGITIRDIYGYMDALGNFFSGDEIVVKVRRSGEIIEMPLTF